VIRHAEYTRARLAQTSDRLRALIHPRTCPVEKLLVSPAVGRIGYEEARRLAYRPAVPGERFGPLWATYWFRAAATVPPGWAGSRVDLLWDSASEATLWLGGRPAQGLDPHHRDAVLAERAAGGERLELEVELACNGLFGRQDAPVELHRCELARFDPDAWRLFHDFETLRALAADAGGLDERWAGELLEELNRFCNEGDRAILDRLYERRNGSATHELAAVGHAHLDTAWLWPLAETYRKAVRTLTTQLRYLDEYPGYRFACPQAQHYAWVRERDPRLWERIRTAVGAGGFVPVGGTWVEPDCNLPSGESLVRQFLHGQGPVNTIGFPRREVAAAPDGGLCVVEAPPYGFGAVVEPTGGARLDGLVLENEHLRAELSGDGSVTSLVEKAAGREALAAPGNRLELYEDRPVAFDAWDVDPFHLETRVDCPPAESHRVVTDSPLRVEVAFERAIGEASRLTQVVRLDAGSRRLEFHTTVHWHEAHRLLKVCFPLAVRSPRATYEMQFGYAERPTHYSTRRDAAQYEVPGHRFADLSEHGFGAAVLSDCKYGYSCFGGELRISLLRAPKSPDEEADTGRHELAYAVLPHAGGWREAGVVAEAARFNAPLRWGPGTRAPESLARVDGESLVLDTIKRAEDSDELVLRLYEPHGARGVAAVRLAFPFERARRANSLEDDGPPLAVDAGAIRVPYRPHELVTVKVS
jgi:alpha-mannosidase